MNALRTISGGLELLVGAPVWMVLLLKITAVLSAAWLAHLALARANPRWRVLLWRATAMGLIALPVVTGLFPPLEIPVESSPPNWEANVVPIDAESPATEKPEEVLEPSSVADAPHGELGAPVASPWPVVFPNEVDAFPSPQPHAQAPSPADYSFVSWGWLLLAGWFGGLALLAFRLSLGQFRIRQMVGRARRPRQWVRDECARVTLALGSRRVVEALQSSQIEAPLLCGLFRPRLLLPDRMCERSYAHDLPAIFAHELTHVRCHDLPWNTGLHLVSIVLWFHPLIWRLRQAHLDACELVCDAVSASFVGDVTDYCRTLARVAIETAASLPAAGIAMARTSLIHRRLNALKRKVFHLPLRRRSVLGFSTAAFLAVVVLGALQLALSSPLPAEAVAVAGEDAGKTPKTEVTSAEKEESDGAAVPTTPADAPPQTGLLQVRVVDEAGRPLGGTKLKAAFLGHKADYTADAEGKATVVAPVPNGQFLSLIAYPEGYPPVRKWWRNDAGSDLIHEEFTFAFEQGRTIGGVVRNEQGKPIPGVKVRLSISSGKYERAGMCLALWDSVFLTDAQGRWRLDHVPRQTNSIAIGLEHPDYISAAGPVQLSGTQQRQIEDRTAVMVMKEGIPVTGTVTGPDGKPVAGATVLLGEWYSPDRLRASTDQQGRYRFALEPGATVLTVACPGLSPALRIIQVQSRMKPVDFRLEPGNTLRVRVVGKDGKPIRGIFVTPDTWRGKRVLCDLGIRGRTDDEGRWTWTWAPKDAVETDFGLTGRVNYLDIRKLPLVPREAEHVVTMLPALTISGRVLDAETQQPVPSFRVVHGYMSTGSIEQIMWGHRGTQEANNGQYRLMIDQPSRVHLMRIEADGYQPAVSREFKDDEGSVTYDVSLVRGRNLNVLVRLPDGQPAAGADVRLCPETPGKFINMAQFVKNGRFPYQDPTSRTMKVAADGQLSIGPQNSPFLLIVVHDQGFARTTSEELIANPTITLEAWARLEGVVRHGTKPVSGAKLDVYPTEPYDPRWSFLNFQDQAESDAEGKFVFAKLKPGKWRVREVPANPKQPPVGRMLHEKAIDLAPGQTIHVTLGGEGRPVVARIQWPGGKPPEGDLSRIGADVRPKLPEMPPPPKAVQDQGPDAVRAWMKRWEESEEGRAWRKQVQQSAECPRNVSVSSNGDIRMDDALPGHYELGVYVTVSGETLPWERPELLRYRYDFSVPEIRGGVSDEPLDLGNVPLEDQTPRKPSLADVKPPAPQSPGQRSVGGLSDHLELLCYVAGIYKENKAKIQTWQGKATIESRSIHDKGAMGDDYAATAQFAFARARKSVRWNTTLEKWSRIGRNQEDPQPVPQISNGMQTPDGLYRLGSFGSPVNPAKRPLTLKIHAPDEPFEGRIQPQLYDFNPLFYLDTPRGDVAEDFLGYIGIADHPGASRIKVIREGDEVTIDMGRGEAIQRYTVSLRQAGNPIRFETIQPAAEFQYRWTYELCDGIWLPKTWEETIHQQDRRDVHRTVTFVENRVNAEVEPAAFSLSRLRLQPGDQVDDRRTGEKRQYDGE